MQTIVAEKINDWAEGLQDRLANYHLQQGNAGTSPTIEIQIGEKYARIILINGPSRSAYGFIDLKTGDLLKADGWKRPAKGKRGNILQVMPYHGCTPYGMEYRR